MTKHVCCSLALVLALPLSEAYAQTSSAGSSLPFPPTKEGMKASAVTVSITVPDEALSYQGPGCPTWYKGSDQVSHYGRMDAGDIQHLFGNISKVAYCIGDGIKLYIDPRRCPSISRTCANSRSGGDLGGLRRQALRHRQSGERDRRERVF